MDYEDLVKNHAPPWPYPILYSKETEVNCDVLVLGGGVAGCWAAIAAAKNGARVVMVEKAATKTSGAGGTGVDHWVAACTNPACKITPEEYTQANIDHAGGYHCGIATYIACRESYDCLLEIEKMGVKVRDSEDEFKGAEFRDEKTKLLFAIDYDNKSWIRVWGAYAKTAVYKECRRLGVNIYDHVMVTSLLNHKGKQGARVVGATGVNVHTGEFYIFKGKASIIGMSHASRNWMFSTELRGISSGFHPGNITGDGSAIAWRAGAELAAFEQSGRPQAVAYGYPQYGSGNAANTWYACTIVDSNGKEIPWVGEDGRILKTVSERYHPLPGNKTVFMGGGPHLMAVRGINMGPGDAANTRKFEAALPLYADLAGMPEMERRVIWGLMVAQEGRTMIPIYHTYNQAGFDPDKDMLQVYDSGWSGVGPPQWREANNGGIVVDWNLKTSLDGLYAAGHQIFAARAGGGHAGAAATGSFAGRNATAYSDVIDEPIIDRRQVDEEKARVYAPLSRTGGVHWKELNAGVCKVMQDYCGEMKTEEMLKLGLKWHDELEAGEAAATVARSPHELLRLLEIYNIMTVNRVILESCRARLASNTRMNFKRLDYPEIDLPEWNRWITIKLDKGVVTTGSLPLDYQGDLAKNYEAHCRL
jgi:succinate dehydrogenase/fumarate reductase flavoprotein subunit